MWVFCCGMFRAASTLQYQLAAELVERHGAGERLFEFVPDDAIDGYCEDLARRMREQGEVPPENVALYREALLDRRRLKVVKHHACSDAIRALFQAGRAIGVHSHRDLRDVAVSAMRKFGFSFDEVLARRWLEQALVEDADWTRLPRVLVVPYEQMVEDLPGVVAALAQHLGLTLAHGEARRLAGEFSLDRQRERIAAMPEPRTMEIAGTPVRFDARSLLHENHIASGATGQWKEALTYDQVVVLERRFGGWLRSRGFALVSGDLS